MFKNITPQRFTIYLAFIVSAINVSVAFLYFLITEDQASPIFYLILFLISIISSYFIFASMIKMYLYRRIKPIYKIIRKTKSNEKARLSNEDFKGKFMENIDKEVSDWVDSTADEIKSLKTLEEYRKDYVGNISHELKTPLFSIQGYVQTILEDADEHFDQQSLHFLNRASANVERLITIVQDLDSITKLESGKTPLDIQVFEIKELAEEVYQDLEFQAKSKNIKLIFKEGASRSFQVRGDRENIRQVFTNLVLNSIKYGNDDGVTKISFYDMHSYILIEVSDNGLGVSDEHLKHLFDRFYRVDKSRSRTEGGSGLGLSIVKHIIEAHGQHLNVRSSLGKGTTFGFTLSKA